MPQRIVVTGAGGQVGRFLAAEATRAGHDVLALTRADWDITEASAGLSIVKPGDVVVNCAGSTSVDAAEADAAAAHAVNAVGAGHVARACARAGARLIHLSTDYVFSGVFPGTPRPYEIDDPTGPRNVYGHSKLAGERAVHAELPTAHVVRTAWAYTGAGTNFVATMRAKAGAEGPVSVVTDQVGSPTYVADLVAALLQVAAGHITAPLLHVTNEGAVSRFELTQAIFAAVGADPGRVRPASSSEHPRPAVRPPYSALSGCRSVEAGLTPLRPWRDALVAALRAAG